MVRLCADSRLGISVFCETTSPYVQSQLDDKAIGFLIPDSDKPDMEIPAIRVGEKVFYTSLPLSVGTRFSESLARPVLSQLLNQSSVPPREMMHTFINGMLDELDPHSSFLSEEEYRELRGGTRGQFGGIGVVIDEASQLPVIREIVPNSPAHVAGVRPGDVLVKIGRKIVSFAGLEAVLKEIREIMPGIQTPVWFFRPKSSRIFRAYLTKEEIPTRSVSQKVVKGRPDVLHIKVTGFSSKTADELYNTYLEAVRSAKGAYRMLVLDLRGNPGGLLDQAVQVADLFIKQGAIVTTKSRYEEQSEFATKGPKISLPTLLLMNSSSASASEIVAGALKDHQRAVIVGERSFGKGSVQSLFELAAGTALKLTIAHYFTPSGFSLQSLGVSPHVNVKLLQMRENALWMSGSSEPEREEGLALHLENPDFGAGQAGTVGDSEQVWSYTPSGADQVRELEELNFSYPGGESLEQNVLLGEDSVARVGVSIMDSIAAHRTPLEKITPAEILPYVEVARLAESRIMRSMLSKNTQQISSHVADLIEGAFLDPKEKTVTFYSSTDEETQVVLEPVKPKFPALERLIVSTRFSENGGRVCCFFSEYQFKLAKPKQGALQGGKDQLRLSAKSARPIGMVGMRIESNADSSVVWVPANISLDKAGNLVGTFEMPAVFRAYVSLNYQQGVSGATFFYKERLDSESLLIGVLPIELPTVDGAQSEYVLPKDTSLTPPQSGGRVSIGVNVPTTNLERNRKYELLVIPLADSRINVQTKKVPLKRNLNGDLYGEVKLNWVDKSTLSSGLGFGGVIGVILQTSGGEIVSKWPLAYVDDYGLRISDIKSEFLQGRKDPSESKR